MSAANRNPKQSPRASLVGRHGKKKQKSKSYSLSLFVSKRGIGKSECVNKEKVAEFEAEKIPLKGGIDGQLYLYNSQSEIPDWVRYLEPVVGSGANLRDQIRTGHSNSGVLVLNLAKQSRCMVFAFGYGKSLIKYENVEIFFGRNVVLNSMKADKILSLKSRSYDRQPRHRENQGTVSAGLNEFDVDFQNEILQKLTGEYDEDFFRDEGFESDTIGRKLTGYDSVTLSTSIPLKEIEDLCIWLCRRFESDAYKKLLPDIDSFCPVKGEDRIAKLNEKILNNIRENKLDGLHLSIPYALDTEEYVQFSIRGLGRKLVEELRGDSISVGDFYEGLVEKNAINDLDIEALKSTYKLICYSNKDPARNRSPALYRCITGEIEEGGNTYTLMDGDWYEIDGDFFARIVKKLNARVKLAFVSLSAYKDVDGSEGGYNQRQCDEYSYLLFDKKDIKLRGRGGVEVCDLLCPSGKFIHVKRYTASATMSHLFSQAYVSIKSLMEDEDFRNTFLKKISSTKVRNRMKAALADRTASVVLGILMSQSEYYRPDKKIENLPAFSIVNLHKFVRDIEALGFKVTVQFVFA